PALAPDSDAALPEVDVLEVEAGQLRDPDPAGIERLQHRAVTPARDIAPEVLAEEGLALVDGEVAGQARTEPGRAELLRRVRARAALPAEEAVEAAERREPPRHRAPGELASVEVGQVPAQHPSIGVDQRPQAPPGQEGRAVGQVSSVALEGV